MTRAWWPVLSPPLLLLPLLALAGGRQVSVLGGDTLSDLLLHHGSGSAEVGTLITALQYGSVDRAAGPDWVLQWRDHRDGLAGHGAARHQTGLSSGYSLPQQRLSSGYSLPEDGWSWPVAWDDGQLTSSAHPGTPPRDPDTPPRDSLWAHRSDDVTSYVTPLTMGEHNHSVATASPGVNGTALDDEVTDGLTFVFVETNVTDVSSVEVAAVTEGASSTEKSVTVSSEPVLEDQLATASAVPAPPDGRERLSPRRNCGADSDIPWTPLLPPDSSAGHSADPATTDSQWLVISETADSPPISGELDLVTESNQNSLWTLDSPETGDYESEFSFSSGWSSDDPADYELYRYEDQTASASLQRISIASRMSGIWRGLRRRVRRLFPSWRYLTTWRTPWWYERYRRPNKKHRGHRHRKKPNTSYGAPRPKPKPRPSHKPHKSKPKPAYGPPKSNKNPSPAYGPPKPKRKPSHSYGPPKPKRKPSPSYGPPNSNKKPSPSYGPPKPKGKPSPSYGPPNSNKKPSPSYGPPKPKGKPMQSYESPKSKPRPRPSYGPPKSNTKSRPAYTPPNATPSSAYGPPKGKPSISYGPPKVKHNQPHGLQNSKPSTSYGSPKSKPNTSYGAPKSDPASYGTQKVITRPLHETSHVKPSQSYGTSRKRPSQLSGPPYNSHTSRSHGASGQRAGGQQAGSADVQRFPVTYSPESVSNFGTPSESSLDAHTLDPVTEVDYGSGPATPEEFHRPRRPQRPHGHRRPPVRHPFPLLDWMGAAFGAVYDWQMSLVDGAMRRLSWLLPEPLRRQGVTRAHQEAHHADGVSRAGLAADTARPPAVQALLSSLVVLPFALFALERTAALGQLVADSSPSLWWVDALRSPEGSQMTAGSRLLRELETLTEHCPDEPTGDDSPSGGSSDNGLEQGGTGTTNTRSGNDQPDGSGDTPSDLEEGGDCAVDCGRRQPPCPSGSSTVRHLLGSYRALAAPLAALPDDLTCRPAAFCHLIRLRIQSPANAAATLAVLTVQSALSEAPIWNLLSLGASLWSATDDDDHHSCWSAAADRACPTAAPPDLASGQTAPEGI